MNASTVLEHKLERTVSIRASRDIVFSFFTDPARWAAWWGSGSSIDARPGGHVLIRHPNGVEAVGEVVEVAAPERLTFTYGYANGTPIPAGGSLVTIRLDETAAYTRLRLVHEFSDAAARDEHVQAWRYQLSLFANVVADSASADAASTVDAWFDAWGDAKTDRRDATLTRITADDIRFSDRFSAIEGRQELCSHFAAIHRFLPGIRLHRTGEIRHCQGVVLAEWVAVADGDREQGRGTTVFVFSPTGRIESVTGFWNRPAQP